MHYCCNHSLHLMWSKNYPQTHATRNPSTKSFHNFIRQIESNKSLLETEIFVNQKHTKKKTLSTSCGKNISAKHINEKSIIPKQSSVNDEYHIIKWLARDSNPILSLHFVTVSSTNNYQNLTELWYFCHYIQKYFSSLATRKWNTNYKDSRLGKVDTFSCTNIISSIVSSNVL